MRLVISHLITWFLVIGGHCIVAVLASTHVEHEKREIDDKKQWVKRDRVHGETLIPVRIGLTQRNLDLGHDELMAISDPDSPRFGSHYTADEVKELFAPSQETRSTVLTWIEAHFHASRISLSSNEQWIHFDASTAEMEDLLRTEFHYYEMPTLGVAGIGCDKYHVPHNVSQHVDYITPGVNFLHLDSNPYQLQRRDASPRAGRKKWTPLTPSEERLLASEPNQCNEKLVSVSCINKIYQIHDKVPNNTGSTVGIWESTHQYYNQTDLRLYLNKFTKINPRVRPKYVPIDGAVKAGVKYNRKNFNSIEANLDLMATIPLAYPHSKVVYYQVDDPVYNVDMTFFFRDHSAYPFGFNTFLDAIDGSYCTYSAFGITGNSPKIDAKYPNPSKKPGAYKGKLQCGTIAPAKVISFSYIIGELLMPQSYLRRQCNEFKKLGLQGITLLFASGDRGVAEHFTIEQDDFCPGKGNHRFGPNSVVNCPYVTAVGSTTLDKNGKEIATTSFPSGGGFSNIYPRPLYQHAAVQNYLTKHTPPYESYNVSYMPRGPPGKGVFNRGGRGYPDISAIGDNYPIILRGKHAKGGGTSLSTPLVAGIISRINAHRLAQGKKTIGFLNPALYKNPGMFTDVVKGNNPGCDSRGFSCAPGWDPVTGLGTPIYPKLKSYLTSLP